MKQKKNLDQHEILKETVEVVASLDSIAESLVILFTDLKKEIKAIQKENS